MKLNAPASLDIFILVSSFRAFIDVRNKNTLSANAAGSTDRRNTLF
jgi:hypothetical protein